MGKIQSFTVFILIGFSTALNVPLNPALLPSNDSTPAPPPRNATTTLLESWPPAPWEHNIRPNVSMTIQTYGRHDVCGSNTTCRAAFEDGLAELYEQAWAQYDEAPFSFDPTFYEWGSGPVEFYMRSYYARKEDVLGMLDELWILTPEYGPTEVREAALLYEGRLGAWFRLSFLGG